MQHRFNLPLPCSHAAAVHGHSLVPSPLDHCKSFLYNPTQSFLHKLPNFVAHVITRILSVRHIMSVPLSASSILYWIKNPAVYIQVHSQLPPSIHVWPSPHHHSLPRLRIFLLWASPPCILLLCSPALEITWNEKYFFSLWLYNCLFYWKKDKRFKLINCSLVVIVHPSLNFVACRIFVKFKFNLWTPTQLSGLPRAIYNNKLANLLKHWFS